jgi:hypothetical protein
VTDACAHDAQGAQGGAWKGTVKINGIFPAACQCHSRYPTRRKTKACLDETGVGERGYVDGRSRLTCGRFDSFQPPPKRAAQTASLVGNEMGYEGKLH